MAPSPESPQESTESVPPTSDSTDWDSIPLASSGSDSDDSGSELLPEGWGPGNILGVFPWEHITGESRAWIRYVEARYGSNFRWCRPRVTNGSDSHWEAMAASSKFEKGIFYDLAGPPLRPTYLTRSPNPTVIMNRDPEWFVLPFFCSPDRSFSDYIEPFAAFDPRPMISKRPDLNPQQRDANMRNASTATMVYLYGQVRLGNKQCQRCRRRRITTNIPAEAIPVCATAGRYYHGICANCLALGGTIDDALRRCDVSNRLSDQEYDQLTRGLGDPGWVGRSPFIGDNATDLAFARNLLWWKVTARCQNPTLGRKRDKASAGSSNTTKVGDPVAASGKVYGTMDENPGLASSSTRAAVRSIVVATTPDTAVLKSHNVGMATSPVPSRNPSAASGSVRAVVRRIVRQVSCGTTALPRTPDTAGSKNENGHAGMASSPATAGNPNMKSPGNRSTPTARRPNETDSVERDKQQEGRQIVTVTTRGTVDSDGKQTLANNI